MEEEKSIKIDITGDSTGILIGRRGETLDSLQYLTSLVVNKGTQEYKRITLDTENYRKKREETLVALANRIADKVVRTGKRVVLEPMNPYERRILHATLHDHEKVETISEGEEPYRRVVVAQKTRRRTREEKAGRRRWCARHHQHSDVKKGTALRCPFFLSSSFCLVGAAFASALHWKKKVDNMREDTICAVATAPGSAGISILRLSGSKAKEVASASFIRARSCGRGMWRWEK